MAADEWGGDGFVRTKEWPQDKVNLDLFWLKDESLEDSDDLPHPDVLVREVNDDMQTALDQSLAVVRVRELGKCASVSVVAHPEVSWKPVLVFLPPQTSRC